MTTSRPGRRRSAATPHASPDDVGRVAAIRDELDARSDEQRRREDKLIASYLSAVGRKTNVVTRRDAAIGDLEQQLRALTEQAGEELAAADEHRAAALAELNKHRSAEKLAVWFGLTPKQVRNLIRAHRARDIQTAPTPDSPGDTVCTTTPDATTDRLEEPPSSLTGNSTPSLEPVTEPPPRTTAVPGPTGTPAALRANGSPDHSPQAVRRPAPGDAERLF